MLRYTLNRILLMIPTLIGVAVLVFFMLRVVPGDVVEVKLRGDGGNVSQETIEMERHRLGLDKPLVYQFKDWMVGLATLIATLIGVMVYLRVRKAGRGRRET